MANRLVHGKTEAPISDRNSPWNEAFTFTPAEWELLKKMRPDLSPANRDNADRLRRWREFAHSSLGRAFRVR